MTERKMSVPLDFLWLHNAHRFTWCLGTSRTTTNKKKKKKNEGNIGSVINVLHRNSAGNKTII